MTKFHEQGYSARQWAMGDTSEHVFEDVESGWVRYGLRRPKLNVAKLPLKIRYTPDYLQADALVEVQAFGKDGLLKVKVEKAEALQLWHADHPVELFVWDADRHQYGRAPWRDLLHELCRSGVGGTFDNDGKTYWALTRACIPVGEWHTYEGELR